VIGSLRGQLTARLADGTSIVDVNGVGYRVALTGPAATSPTASGDVELAIHTHVREDAIVLYGFLTARERDCFEALLAAPGVGPTLAQSIMGSLGPEALARALASDDVDALCAVPGVGRKTAARLLLELRGRLVPEAATVAQDGTPSVGAEVRGALGELGYTSEEVRRAIDQLDETASVEDALRQALRVLSRR
jgi:Holliday junction DNA helicase RuvA